MCLRVQFPLVAVDAPQVLQGLPVGFLMAQMDVTRLTVCVYVCVHVCVRVDLSHR